MNILFITDNFPPEVNAPATRTYEHCREWTKAGAAVTIITCAPNFPKGEVYEGYKNKLYQTETIDGIKVIRVWSYITANEGAVKRILDYMSFAFAAFWVGLFQKTDIIIATSPQFFTTWAACVLSFLKRKPWIFELRDLWPESIAATGAMSGGKIIHILEKIELFLYRNSAKVVAVTEAFRTNLVRRGIPKDKIEVVTNGSNLDLYRPMPKDTALLQQLQLEGKFIIGYIGTHGLAHSLDFIIKTAAKVTQPDIHFLFVGEGAEKANIVAMAKAQELTNVTFLSSIPKHEVPAYLSITDISLIPLKKSDTFKTVIPSKIFECACMQKPILLGVEGQAKEIITTYNAGQCFEPENEQSFLAALNRLYNDKHLYQSHQKGCDDLANNFDRVKLADKMLSIIKAVSSKK